MKSCAAQNTMYKIKVYAFSFRVLTKSLVMFFKLKFNISYIRIGTCASKVGITVQKKNSYLQQCDHLSSVGQLMLLGHLLEKIEERQAFHKLDMGDELINILKCMFQTNFQFSFWSNKQIRSKDESVTLLICKQKSTSIFMGDSRDNAPYSFTLNQTLRLSPFLLVWPDLKKGTQVPNRVNLL